MKAYTERQIAILALCLYVPSFFVLSLTCTTGKPTEEFDLATHLDNVAAGQCLVCDDVAATCADFNNHMKVFAKYEERNVHLPAVIVSY